jgi:hypothetical protein
MKNGKSKPVRLAPEITLRKLRSSISNGSSLLADVDHRSAWMRRLRDLIGDHVGDLGGEAALSTAELALVRRAAMLTLQLELMESRWCENDGGEASPRALETYQRATGALRRTLESLGLQRRSRDVTPTLEQYAAKHREREGVAR